MKLGWSSGPDPTKERPTRICAVLALRRPAVGLERISKPWCGAWRHREKRRRYSLSITLLGLRVGLPQHLKWRFCKALLVRVGWQIVVAVGSDAVVLLAGLLGGVHVHHSHIQIA